ncbi:MAG TPA: phosphoribosylglycinamide formyltransferase [Dokdonella sp.]|uniref:phosphoribosylglycinamide formyltransferase n=1 Tax=Dokdonella sp. TaxID=2291710 RepID=UPI002C494BD3|nr:phosphoribosylglycinamide formyltransferase [Dokdonella sp.]HUD40444.1 phosphoribosylglycinamide formyltransferase [Dokdonella sp.]
MSASPEPPRLVVFASGRGSNFLALVEAVRDGRLPVRIAALFSDRPGCAAVAAARALGIPTVALRPRDFADRAGFDRALFAELAAYRPDLLVLAGFLRILDPAVIAPWTGRIINIHPSLLPKYPGLDTHRRALTSGDAFHGASVHYVGAELDAGPVIAQATLAVAPGDTPETLAARLLVEEHRLLPAVIDLIARGRIALDGTGVCLDGQALPRPLQLEAGGLARG